MVERLSIPPEQRGNTQKQRILAVWFPHFPAERQRRADAEKVLKLPRSEEDASSGRVKPLVLVDTVKNALRVTACDPLAAELGVPVGETLADARAAYPDLDVRPADPHGDMAALLKLADWSRRFTPLVGLDDIFGPEGLILDITGCAHLFEGEAAMRATVEAAYARLGLTVRTGLADTVGAAWAAARYTGQTGSGVIAPGAERAALLPLPLAALRLDADRVAGLERLGLKTVADIADKPRAPLTARAGKMLLKRLAQAFGDEGEAITPRLPVSPAMAERVFAEPIAREEDIEATAKALAERLTADLERRGEGARTLDLTLFRVDGKVTHLTAGTSRPLREPTRIVRLFKEKFAAAGSDWDAGFGFDLIRLSARTTEPLDPAQITTDLAGEVDADEALSDLVDRLSARLGMDYVLRLRLSDTHIPEQASDPVQAALYEAPKVPEPETEAGTRPLHLFSPPEPIEALAEIPDGPPLRFRWRRMLHEVTRVEGPERIASEWWRSLETETPPTRDYFRIEDRDGARFWVFRNGLYGAETADPRWYMHGVFP